MGEGVQESGKGQPSRQCYLTGSCTSTSTSTGQPSRQGCVSGSSTSTSTSTSTGQPARRGNRIGSCTRRCESVRACTCVCVGPMEVGQMGEGDGDRAGRQNLPRCGNEMNGPGGRRVWRGCSSGSAGERGIQRGSRWAGRGWTVGRGCGREGRGGWIGGGAGAARVVPRGGRDRTGGARPRHPPRPGPPGRGSARRATDKPLDRVSAAA